MDKVIPIASINNFLKDDMVVAIGGFMGCGTAHRIVDEILKTSVKNLTLVATDTALDNYGIGKLIRAKWIKKLLASHIGTNKETQAQASNGQLELELIPQGTLAERIRIAGAGIGGFLTKTGLGTEVALGKQVIKVDGQEYLLEKPLPVDIAFINGKIADKKGNLSFHGSMNNFNTAMAKAATITIAEVDEILEEGYLDPDSIHLPFIFVNHIVEV